MRTALSVLFAALVTAGLEAWQDTSPRRFQPDDLFRLRGVAGAAWSPDGRRVAIQLGRPERRWLATVPSTDLHVLDAASRTLRRVSPASPAYIGFFAPSWSPDGRRLAFLSLQADAGVRLWIWRADTGAATAISGIDVQTSGQDRPLTWVDRSRLATIAWDPGAQKSGEFYLQVLRGRNQADVWTRTRDGRGAAVATVSSGGAPATDQPHGRLVVVEVNAGTQRTLTRGRLSRLTASPDACCVSVRRWTPGRSMASLFDLAGRTGDVDQAYDAVSRGTQTETIDLRTGDVVPAPPAAAPAPAPALPVLPALPRPTARPIASSPSGDAALLVANDADGSRLWIAGGGGRPLTRVHEAWAANQWLASVTLGRAQPLSHAGPGGSTLTAWLLLPPGHRAGTRIPIVTRVYPGTVYSATTPPDFSPHTADFEHAQLFAARGYAVLLPSIPIDDADPHAFAPIVTHTLSAVDAAIAAGIADPDRIALLGQSGGGFAALALITQTPRFRTAIVSAGYSNLTSLYGTFYGSYRHGDGGRVEDAAAFRMLQLERGFMGLGGPPWLQRERYDRNSPLLQADRVTTPLLLIHGELDFIPVQQAEEFFAALLRQDKRALLLRYAGETHTLQARAHVVDLWRRLDGWLRETLQ